MYLYDHISEQLIGFQMIRVLCVSGIRWHSKFAFSLGFCSVGIIIANN